MLHKSYPLIAAALAGLMACRHSNAQPPDYGFQWATVTHPGNRAANQTEAPEFFPPFNTPALNKGSVGYNYRIATTEVTTSHWLEFVQAYAPYHAGPRTLTAFTSWNIFPTSLDPDEPAGYVMRPGTENVAVTMSWYFAARYVNWLENGKAPQREAFESGVYDAATFAQNPDGTWPQPGARAPGAQFWIPTVDEWVKAAFYDPNRYGEDQEGYWQRPNRGDALLIPGLPQNGGQTLHGAPDELRGDYPVGLFSNVLSPWGLLDVSGGVTEWLGDGAGWSNVVFTMGTRNFGLLDERSDRVDQLGATFATSATGHGLRIASAIPSPSAGAFAIGAIVVLSSRRRRRLACDSSQRSRSLFSQ